MADCGPDRAQVALTDLVEAMANLTNKSIGQNLAQKLAEVDSPLYGGSASYAQYAVGKRTFRPGAQTVLETRSPESSAELGYRPTRLG